MTTSATEEIKYAVRSQIVAPPNHILMQFDLSQAETWVSAHLAKEQNMIHSLKTGDIHTDTAIGIFNIKKPNIPTYEERYLGKKGNHSLTYRSSANMLVISINAESDKPPFITVSYKQGKVIYDGWHSLYNLHTWWNEIETQLSKNRKLITPYGRERIFYEHWGPELFKEATAHVPQSTVADHLNGAVQPEVGIEGGLLSVYERFATTKAVTIINQSHDSFLCEVPEGNFDDIGRQIYQLLLRPIIINGEEFTIPVDCEIGHRFGELEKYKKVKET